MKTKSAIDYLDKTLVLWRDMSYFSDDPKVIPANLDDRAQNLMTKALEKFCRDGYMTEERTELAPKKISRTFKVTFEGNFVLEKYKDRPYYKLAKKERRRRRYEYVKVVAIIINAIATLYLLTAQTFGWKFPLTQKPDIVNQVGAQPVTNDKAANK